MDKENDNRESTKALLKRKLKENSYSMKSKVSSPSSKQKFRSSVWATFYEIVDDNDAKVNGFVCCKHCKAIFNYDSKSTGTSNLKGHKCCVLSSSSGESSTQITSFFPKKDTTINQLDRAEVKRRCIGYVIKDLQPMNAVSGAGLAGILSMFTKIGSQYGYMDTEQISKILPHGSTVSYNCLN